MAHFPRQQSDDVPSAAPPATATSHRNETPEQRFCDQDVTTRHSDFGIIHAVQATGAANAIRRPSRPATLKSWLGNALRLRSLPRLGCGALALFAVLLPVHGAISKEYQLKAAFLYNFTKFVEWQTAHSTDAATPLTIGVLGNNPFGDELEHIVHGRKVNGRNVVIKEVSSAEAATVNVLFVTAGEEKQFEPLRTALQAAGVLTVGESEEFTRLGGIITFVPEGGKIRFEINIVAARDSYVKISAELQKLARTVRRAS
jgi:hypothetical protein